MAISNKDIEQTKYKYENIRDCLSEKGRRIWAAIEATTYGRGGIKLICKATGISSATLYKGIDELSKGNIDTGRIRKKGGGHKSYKITQPGILKTLDDLVDPTSKGNPENPLKWTSKSVRKLAKAMKKKGYNVGKTTIGIMLHNLGYSLQANKKTLEKSDHIDRDAQFKYINKKHSECTHVITASNIG